MLEATAPGEPEAYEWFAPMVLWPVARGLVYGDARRSQGGGIGRPDERAIFAAVLFVLASGSVWRDVPKVFGVSWQTAHRRFWQWTEAGLWAGIVDGCPAGQAGVCERQWALVTAERAIHRSRSTRDKPGGAETKERPSSAPPATGLDDDIRPRIKRQLSDDFAERLFGPREAAGRATGPRQETG